MTESYDCIVLGVGGFGSAALYHLAERGLNVLGLEQFDIAHDLGSSHGETRIIRKAYFEHSDYVPLLKRSYELWRALEAETDRRLYHPVGLFIAGAPEGEVVSGTLQAARLHGLPLQQMTPREAEARYPGYRIPDGFQVLFEEDAGYLEVENCVSTLVDAALHRGATIHTHEPVRAWHSDGKTVRIETDRDEYVASRLIVTAGAWAGRILTDLNLPLQVVRKPLFWFPASAKYDVANGNSAFFYEMPEGHFYGFPRIDGQTLKVAEHTGGDDVANPLTVDRSLHLAEQHRVASFLSRCLPEVGLQPAKHAVCLYTRTPDCHFIIDRHPQLENVVLGAGFSGHGFKFTSALGEVLADLAMEGRTSLPIEFLSINRPGLKR